MSSATEHDTDLLILGGSFAGIEVLYQLQRKEAGRRLKTIVVDRQRTHGYLPLVHERLVGRIDRAATELPTARYVSSLPHVRFVQDEVVAFDAERHEVTLGSGDRLRARFVVVALGSVLAAPPGLPGREHLLGHKLRPEFERAVAALERACTSSSSRVLVVGGGVSGVELAGELAHLRVQRPAGWHAPEVVLASRGPRLLPTHRGGVGARADRHLRAQGVDVRVATELVSVGEGTATLRDAAGAEQELSVAASFWAGGIAPAPVLRALDLPRTADGWLEVGPTLQCFPVPAAENPEIFACGDAVRIHGGEGRWPTMQRAIECLWQASVVAGNILALARAEPGFPAGVPTLRPHRLREDFYYGISLGARSLVVRGGLVIDRPRLDTWFRRFLMRKYFERYAPG